MTKEQAKKLKVKDWVSVNRRKRSTQTKTERERKVRDGGNEAMPTNKR